MKITITKTFDLAKYENLRKFRNAIGLSLKEVGRSIGADKSSISNWETGKTKNKFTLEGYRNSLIKFAKEQGILSGVIE